MNKVHKQLRLNSVRISMYYMIIFVVVFIGIALLVKHVYEHNKPINILRDTVITDSKFLKDAVVISQTSEDTLQDSFHTLHARIPEKAALQIVEQNILKECENEKNSCTKPVWFKSKGERLEIGIADYYNTNVYCTAHWRIENSQKNNITTVCVDTLNGNLWYQYESF